MKDETKIPKSRQKKQQVVAEVVEKIEKAKLMVFANYQGMTHKQIEQLKKGLRSAHAELAVTKNTLLKRALKDKEQPADEAALQNPTATLFAYEDPILPLKELNKMIKALKMPSIKFGIFEGKLLSADDVVKLSALPTRDVLLAQFVGSLKSPIYGLHRALSWNMQKLVLTLNAIQAKKQ